MVNHVKYDDGAKGFFLLFAIAQLFLNNGILLFLGVILFYFVFFNLQQPYKPTVFSILFIYHFIQIASGVWWSNWTKVDINYKSPSISQAIVVSYFGLFFLILPIIYYHNKIPAFSFETIKKSAYKLDLRKTFILYVISYFVIGFISFIALGIAGFAQILISLKAIKWMFFLLFGYQVFLKKKMFVPFIVCALFEFVSGFYSYFSDFKTVLIFSLALALFFLKSARLNQIIVGIVAGVAGFFLLAFYNNIKGEYRGYLNQGGKGQVVAVDKQEALGKLAQIAKDSAGQDMNQATAKTLDRIQYTFHLAKVMDRLPTYLDYEYGANWGRTISFVFTPRLLNPEKPIYKATEKAKKYTGIMYSGYEQGTSFSLGYFADGYIDFGMYGMVIPLLILGFIYGVTYLYFVKKLSYNYLFNCAGTTAMFMEFYAYEMDSTFLLGRLAATLLTFFVLSHIGFPQLLTYLETPSAKRVE